MSRGHGRGAALAWPSYRASRFSPASGRSAHRRCDLRAHPYVKRAVKCGDRGVDGVMRLVGWAKRKVAEGKSPAELAEVDKTAEVVRQKALVLSR